jgi:hypothetical protein
LRRSTGNSEKSKLVTVLPLSSAKGNNPVSLLPLDNRMLQMGGVQFLSHAIDVYPEARRVLLLPDGKRPPSWAPDRGPWLLETTLFDVLWPAMCGTAR